MKTITFHFVTSKDDAISAIIRLHTGSEISHVEVLSLDRQHYEGALMDGGFEARPLDYSKWTLEIFVEIRVTDEQHAIFWAYCSSMIGKKYDAPGILGIAVDRSIHDPSDVFCSEAMACAVTAAQIVRIAKSPWRVTPEEFRLVVTAIPGAIETRKENLA